jgi:hypothetical protein
MLRGDFYGTSLFTRRWRTGWSEIETPREAEMAKFESRSTFRLHEDMHRAVFEITSYPLQKYRVSIDYCSCRNQWWPSIDLTLSSKRQLSTDICPRECRQTFPERLRLSDCQTTEDRNLAGWFRSVSSAPSKTKYFHFTNWILSCSIEKRIHWIPQTAAATLWVEDARLRKTIFENAGYQ